MIYALPAPRTQTATKVYNAALKVTANKFSRRPVKNVLNQKSVKMGIYVPIQGVWEAEPLVNIAPTIITVRDNIVIRKQCNARK